MTQLKILILNGANLNLLGKREPELYGHRTLSDLKNYLEAFLSDASTSDIKLKFEQSNSESEFINLIASEYDVLIINPGAWTHTSLAIADALAAADKPTVEVHLTNITGRESLRNTSLMAPHVQGAITGFGFDSYKLALLKLIPKNCLLDSPR